MAQQPAWHKKDAKALRAIRLRIVKDVLVYTQDATTSKEAWDTLAKTFQETGPIGIIEAQHKLFRAQCPEGGDIEELLCKLQVYCSKLNTLGQTISDPDFSLTILTSLPESWNPFIQAIDRTDLIASTFGQLLKLTSTKLIACILQEDRRGKRNDAQDTALKAINKSNATCHNCSRRGHYARKCCSKPRVADSSPDSDTTTNATALAVRDPDTYYLDSGATVHVARDHIQFRQYTNTPGRTIQGVGGQEVAQLGQGSIKILSHIDRRSPIPIMLQHIAHIPSATHNLISVSRITKTGVVVCYPGIG
ncbi:hypothetical protein VTO73DRAFT_6018 [Trametes versicolor]